MGRNPRTLSESGIYHIMFRGTNKQPIFLDDKDYNKLLEILIKIKEIVPYEIYAYCLMSNHVHLVIKEFETGDISKIMQRLLTKYARWYNIKYDRTGTLLEGRYRSQVVADDEYFMHLIRYVHQNPLKACMVDNISDYLWSSYRSYEQYCDDWIDKAFVRELLPGAQFEKFHMIEEEEHFELFDKRTKSDEDLLKIMNSFDIQSGSDLFALKFANYEKFELIVRRMKESFSERHIERVTGIKRHNLRI